MKDILKEKISDIISGGRAVVAIDGNCAAGKTTLANEIQSAFGGTVIHADSFFLSPDMRSGARLSEPGGNFHYERFRCEVADNLKSDAPFSYGVFDCSCGRITHTITVDEPKLLIIEGSYCMHPNLSADYDLRIFCCTDLQTQLERIKKRNGEKAVESFRQKWIPLENRYFEFYDVKNKCDIKIVT